MACGEDKLDLKLKEIKYYAEHSVGRCDKAVISDLKQKTQNVIFEANDKNRPDLKKRAENLLYELNSDSIKCW